MQGCHIAVGAHAKYKIDINTLKLCQPNTYQMKHIMNFASHGKLQLIDHFSNFLNHFVGTIKSWFEIFWTFTFYGGLFVGLQRQIYQVIHFEVSLHSMLVS